LSNWYAEAARFFGGFPDDYVVFDNETTGTQVASPATFITQFGYAIVKGRRCVDNFAVVLNWSLGLEAIPVERYCRMIADVTSGMAARGSQYQVSWRMIVDQGVEPLAALDGFRAILEDAQQAGLPLVGHNAYAFDRVLNEHAFRRYDMPFKFDVENLIDTGILEKCRRLGYSPPVPGACSREDWFDRVSRKVASVKWSLANACVPEYGLLERLGGETSRAHDAGFDCLLTHHLLEAMRERALQDNEAQGA